MHLFYLSLFYTYFSCIQNIKLKIKFSVQLSTVHTHKNYKDFCRWRDANAITRIIFKIGKLLWWVQSQIFTSYCHNMLLTFAQHLHAVEGVKGTMLCYLLKLNIKFLEWGKRAKEVGFEFSLFACFKGCLKDVINKKHCILLWLWFRRCSQFSHHVTLRFSSKGDYYI